MWNPKKQWRRLQELTILFLASLVLRAGTWFKFKKKWFDIRSNLKIWDVVLMISPDSPHACWPLARVLEVYTGKDGLI